MPSVSALQTKFQDKRTASKFTTRAKWLYMYKDFCPNAKGRWRRKMGNIPAGTAQHVPLPKEAETEMNLCANLLNSEAERLHPSAPPE